MIFSRSFIWNTSAVPKVERRGPQSYGFQSESSNESFGRKRVFCVLTEFAFAAVCLMLVVVGA